MLIAERAIPTKAMSLWRDTAIANGRFLAQELVFTIIVVLSKDAGPFQYNMRFNFLGYGGWIFFQFFGDTGITLFVVQGFLYDFPVFSSQVFILFHSRYLLKTETQHEKNNISRSNLSSRLDG